MDKIRIQNLEVFAKHGVNQEENILGQKFLLSAVLYTDTRQAGKTDSIEDSIHYGKVCHFMTAFMREHTFKLIESAAEQLAEAMLLHYPRLEAVDLEIKKPWAPIGLPIETVSVEISRGWHEVYLSIGSNLGDRKEYLDGGLQNLSSRKEIRNVKSTEYIETEPYGGVEQGKFLNACVRLETLLPPEELLDVLHEAEDAAGRERAEHWGPRTLDLDILFYDDLVMDSEDLVIPHIDMQNRRFVLEPLAELCPGKVHPVLQRTVKQLLAEMEEPEQAKPVRRLFSR